MLKLCAVLPYLWTGCQGAQVLPAASVPSVNPSSRLFGGYPLSIRDDNGFNLRDAMFY